MMCKDCGYHIVYSEELTKTDCIVCGKFMTPTTDDVFQHGMFGLVSEKRESQIAYARDVQDLVLMNESGTALLEAGTGVGKSYGYFIPAILTNKRVVISTATKNLQEQLAKDLPKIVEKVGGDPKTVSIYKGANNYACSKLGKNIANPAQRSYFEKWVAWYNKNKRPADVIEWKGPRPVWWNDISAENCPMTVGCPHGAYCRPLPSHYSVLIVNHALLAIDLLLMGPGALLGVYDMLVVDEAHKASTFFRNVLTGTVSKSGLERTQKTLKFSTPLRTLLDITDRSNQAKDLDESAKKLSQYYKEVITTLRPSKDKKKIDDTAPVIEPLYAMLGAASDLSTALNFAARTGHKERETGRVSGFTASYFNSIDELNAAISTARKLLTTYQSVLSTLKRIVQASSGNDLITADKDGLYVQPVNISKYVGSALKHIRYKVVTSATLQTDNSFDHVKSQMGIPYHEEGDSAPEVLIENAYPGAFDYDSQVRVYMPMTVPPPRYDDNGRSKWVKAQAHEISQLVQGTKGDALVLFTAKKDLEEVWNAVNHEELSAQGVSLIRQEGDAAHALKTYQNTPSSVLFGLKSFWEGVNLPGQKLRLVIVTKLPFPPKDDPLFQALRQKAGKKAFSQVDIPEMITDMRQATGRLIRTQSDRGVVAILDSRVWTGNSSSHYTILRDIELSGGRPQGYGWKLIKSLGYRKRVKTFTEAVAFANYSVTE